MNTMKMLTTATIKAMRPGDKRQEVKDPSSVGLYLVLQPSGHRSFALRFRGLDGKPQKLVLGPFDPAGETDSEPVVGHPLTLASARRLAAELNRERLRGKDIRAKKEVSSITFSQVAQEFVREHVMKRNRRGKQVARLLGVDGDIMTKGGLCSRWSAKAITEVTAGDVYEVVQEARQRGVPGMAARTQGPSEARARHLHGALSALFGWAHKHRKVTVNPCRDVHPPEPGTSRDRVLAEAELVRVWEACGSLGEPFGTAIRLLVLTGSRLNEVAGMRRSEINGDVWMLPADRSKNKRPHALPLPPLALELLASIPDTGDLFFSTNGRTAVSGWSKVKVRLDKLSGVEGWRLHDIRRTAATGMASIGVAPHIVEAVLNHVSGAKAGVAGIYNRAAYGPEKRAALDVWADHVQALVTPNVVPLRRPA